MRFLSFGCLFLFVFIFGCKNESSKVDLEVSESKVLPLKYAKGFSITDFESYKVIEIKSPWQNSDKSFQYQLLNENVALFDDYGNNFDATINTPIKKIVVTSTTHIPALELLNVQNTLVAFPETNYVSSETTRKRIDQGLVRDLGKNEGINIEYC